jgi:hypothetical protein
VSVTPVYKVLIGFTPPTSWRAGRPFCCGETIRGITIEQAEERILSGDLILINRAEMVERGCPTKPSSE